MTRPFERIAPACPRANTRIYTYIYYTLGTAVTYIRVRLPQVTCYVVYVNLYRFHPYSLARFLFLCTTCRYLSFYFRVSCTSIIIRADGFHAHPVNEPTSKRFYSSARTSRAYDIIMDDKIITTTKSQNLSNIYILYRCTSIDEFKLLRGLFIVIVFDNI